MWLMLFICIFARCMQCSCFASEDAANFQKEVEVFSEYLGYAIGEDLTLGLKGCYNLDALMRGIRKFEQGLAPKTTRQEELQARIEKIQKNFYNIRAEENLKKANEFLSTLSKNKGIISLENGKLLYEEIIQGKGREITTHDETITVRHLVRTVDGNELINTFESETPASINLAETIAGFIKGIVGMRVGGKRRLYIHPDLAYKTAGKYAPNLLLVIEVELVSQTA